MDFDFDYLSAVDPNESFPPSQSLQTDYVKWQSSQVPCPVLKSLMLKSNLRKPVPIRIAYSLFSRVTARKQKPFTPWHSSDPSLSTSFQPSTSASLGSASATRPLRRTNSRPRFGRHSEPDTRSPLQAPDLNIFNTGDSSQFLDLVKTVAERVDENAGFRAKSNDVDMKRKTRNMSPISTVDVSARVRKSRPGSAAKEEVRASRTKGIHRENSGTEPMHEDNSSSSLMHGVSPLSSSSSSSSSSSFTLASSSAHSTNRNMQMDIDIADTPVSMSTNSMADMDVLDSSVNPAPISRRRPLLRTSSASLGSAADLALPDTRNTTLANPTTSTPRLHPLLSQQPPQRQHSPPRALPPQRVQPPPRVYAPQRAQRPPASQTSATMRPPVLGMRRTHSAVITSYTAPQPLPTRQKAFKPPLQSQSQAQRLSQSQSSRSVITTVEKDGMLMQPVKKEGGDTLYRDGRRDNKVMANFQPPSNSEGEPSSTEPETNPDADSSFGDISFDIDALEETMRMYD